MKKFIIGIVLFGTLTWLAPQANANEYTDVIDAFDNQNKDPFDINISIGYEREQRTSTITREVTSPDIIGIDRHNWDYYAKYEMFKYKQITHLLNTSLDIGLYKDLSLKVRMPIILVDTRELTTTKDFDANGWEGEELFTIDSGNPFHSPDRSGLDYIAAGMWWGILDQGRDESKPNWTVFAEGRFGIGEQLTAACASGCFSDFSAGDPGISRGLNEINVGFSFSRRFGVLDPYFGLNALLGWPKGGGAYSQNSANAINNNPPMVGNLDFGMEIVPWEMREAHRKLVIGLGAGGSYHSEGREYTPLFDALGTSDYFHNDDYFPDFNGNGRQDENGFENFLQTEYSGLTDVENYVTAYAQLFVLMQPAKYIKFRLGTRLAHETEHFITKTDQCSSGNIDYDGMCTSPNMGYRPEIDEPGTRFRAEKTFVWNFFFDATAQF